ncbi:MAG TPA: flagellar basal-body rod protein FlgF [Bryobacteraceae bacterium]|nr:flagellar basal-body rod protein FlgF [Bryobacteraceae bacterium]
MDNLTIAAAGGMRSRMESLDLLANNLANTETGGYKADREFYNLYVSAEAANADASPTSLPVIETSWTDFSQGVLRPTGNSLDLALSGKGFFAVSGPSGDLYTRNGSFHLTPQGMLVTKEGYAVRTVSGGNIQVQGSAELQISPDGTVTQSGQTLGRLALADFSDAGSLVKQGNSFFQSTADPQTPSAVQVEQGKLESSNVGAAESAVRLVSVMRQFEMLQKAAALGEQMNQEDAQEVARVAS